MGGKPPVLSQKTKAEHQNEEHLSIHVETHTCPPKPNQDSQKPTRNQNEGTRKALESLTCLHYTNSNPFNSSHLDSTTET